MSPTQAEYQQERTTARQELTSMFTADILLENVSDETLLTWARASCEVALRLVADTELSPTGPRANKLAYLLRDAASFAILCHFIVHGELYEYEDQGVAAVSHKNCKTFITMSVEAAENTLEVLRGLDNSIMSAELAVETLARTTATALTCFDRLRGYQPRPPEALILAHLKLTRAAYF